VSYSSALLKDPLCNIQNFEGKGPFVRVLAKDLLFVANMAEELAEDAISQLQYDGLTESEQEDKRLRLDDCMHVADWLCQKARAAFDEIIGPDIEFGDIEETDSEQS